MKAVLNHGILLERIIPLSKLLVTPIYKPFRPFGRGITQLGDLLNMVITHLLSGMILQVPTLPGFKACLCGIAEPSSMAGFQHASPRCFEVAVGTQALLGGNG